VEDIEDLNAGNRLNRPRRPHEAWRSRLRIARRARNGPVPDQTNTHHVEHHSLCPE
jgi:hypothetical protein